MVRLRRRLGLAGPGSGGDLSSSPAQEGTNLEVGQAQGEEQSTNPAQKGRVQFVDPEDMKSKVRQGLLRPAYNVADFYHKTGIWQMIARHQLFENITLAVISLNALWIWIDTDFNPADVLLEAKPVFQVADNFFCAYFSFEWFVRFRSFKRKRDCLKDAWFVFDSCLVSLMVLETWVMTGVMLATGAGAGGGFGNASLLRIFRLLRLSRMSRMVRLFRVMPELVILVKAISTAMRSVFYTLLLLCALLYLFGITFRQLSGSNPILQQSYFSSVPASMYNLLIHGTLLDNIGTMVFDVGSQSVICVTILWVFILLSSLTVMNMLIGILCEVVSAVSASEREAILISFVKDKMQELFQELGEDGSGSISRQEFLMVLEKPEACRVLQDVGVDVVGLVDQVDAIFADDNLSSEGNKTLDFPDLIAAILSLRGSCTATVKDIIDFRKFIRAAVTQTTRSLVQVEERLAVIEQSATASQTASGPWLAKRDATSVVESSVGEATATDALQTGGGDYGDAGDVRSEVASITAALESKLADRTESFQGLISRFETELAEARDLRRRVEGLMPRALEEKGVKAREAEVI